MIDFSGCVTAVKESLNQLGPWMLPKRSSDLYTMRGVLKYQLSIYKQTKCTLTQVHSLHAVNAEYRQFKTGFIYFQIVFFLIV